MVNSKPPAPGGSNGAVFGWVMFDWASQPFFTLVTTFVFAPYFAAHFIGDASRGQSLWAFAVASAGVSVALLSPVLGAIADEAGRRKPWIAAASIALVAGCAALWWAEPGAEHRALFIIAAFCLASIGAEFATVFTNAMLPDLAGPERIGRISGLGWATGYVGGLIALGAMLAVLIGSPQTGKTLIGIDPPAFLDPSSFAGDRFSGPLSALWYAIFIVPLFLLTPDRPQRMPIGEAVRAGLTGIAATLRQLRHHGAVARYLIARMFFYDGLSALFAFGGVYAAGTFGWGAQQVGVFGIILIVAATIGAYGGGYLDDLWGPRKLILRGLVLLALASIGVLSVTADRIFFVVASGAARPDAFLSSTAEIVYIAIGCLIGIVAGPIQSASRTLLARLAPPEHMTQFFGLYALSGKATAFMAPATIGLLTAWSGSQRIGISAIVFYLAVGFVLLLGVPDRRRSGSR